jgi:circadian clock protein KaiC
LDELIGGGLPEGTWTMILGDSGSGKTLLGMQYIWTGLRVGEGCVIDTAVMSTAMMRRKFQSIGWDIKPYEKNRTFRFCQSFPRYSVPKEDWTYYPSSYNLLTLRMVDEELQELKPGVRLKRLLCDGLVPGLDPIQEARIMEWSVEWAMREGVTGVFTAVRGGRDQVGESMLRQYSDNVLELKLFEEGGRVRRMLRIAKMLDTDHPLDWMPYRITRKGFELPRETSLSKK